MKAYERIADLERNLAASEARCRVAESELAEARAQRDGQHEVIAKSIADLAAASSERSELLASLERAREALRREQAAHEADVEAHGQEVAELVNDYAAAREAQRRAEERAEQHARHCIEAEARARRAEEERDRELERRRDLANRNTVLGMWVGDLRAAIADFLGADYLGPGGAALASDRGPLREALESNPLVGAPQPHPLEAEVVRLRLLLARAEGPVLLHDPSYGRRALGSEPLPWLTVDELRAALAGQPAEAPRCPVCGEALKCWPWTPEGVPHVHAMPAAVEGGGDGEAQEPDAATTGAADAALLHGGRHAGPRSGDVHGGPVRPRPAEAEGQGARQDRGTQELLTAAPSSGAEGGDADCLADARPTVSATSTIPQSRASNAARSPAAEGGRARKPFNYRAEVRRLNKALATTSGALRLSVADHAKTLRDREAYIAEQVRAAPPRPHCHAMREAAARAATLRAIAVERESKLLDRAAQEMSYQRILEADRIAAAIRNLRCGEGCE